MEYLVHLVQDKDRSLKACNGELYISPTPKHGDTLVLCKNCVAFVLPLKDENA